MKKSIICFLMVLVSFFAVQPNTGVLGNTHAVTSSGLPEISSRAALLLDYNTGKVLYEKEADERLPIASMTKLASLAIIFDAIGKGIIKESDMVSVSENAASVGGSSAFLDAGSKYTVKDLVKTIIIASANDSTVALAEYVAGSEEMFVSRMNKFAQALALENTHFENSTGLPCDGHYSSARDMAKIYKTMCGNKLYTQNSKIWMDDFVHPSGRKTGLVNTNRLVKTYDGIEGGKTGYTDSARFCLTASAKRGSTRLVGVVIGANDSKTRFAEMSRLFNYGFANFETKMIVNSEFPVAITTFKGSKQQTPVFASNDLYKFTEKGQEKEFSVDYEIFELKAPISAGSIVGKMFVFDENNMVVNEVDLIVKEDIFEVGVKDIINKIINIW